VTTSEFNATWQCPTPPQQNGVEEHCNQTVVGTARSMMKTADMHAMF
jgi:hypothetical protein